MTHESIIVTYLYNFIDEYTQNGFSETYYILGDSSNQTWFIAPSYEYALTKIQLSLYLTLIELCHEV